MQGGKERKTGKRKRECRERDRGREKRRKESFAEKQDTVELLLHFFNSFVDQCLLQDLLEAEFVVLDDNGSHPEMCITL